MDYEVERLLFYLAFAAGGVFITWVGVCGTPPGRSRAADLLLGAGLLATAVAVIPAHWPAFYQASNVRGLSFLTGVLLTSIGMVLQLIRLSDILHRHSGS